MKKLISGVLLFSLMIFAAHLAMPSDAQACGVKGKSTGTDSGSEDSEKK